MRVREKIILRSSLKRNNNIHDILYNYKITIRVVALLLLLRLGVCVCVYTRIGTLKKILFRKENNDF